MGASEISGIGSLFTQGQPQSTVAGSKGDTLEQTFHKVMNQMQTPVGGNAPQREPEASSPSYDYKQQGQSKPIKPRDDAAISRDRQEQLGKKLEEFSEDVKDVLCEEFGITEEQLTEAMETLGLTFADLLNPNQLAALVGELTGEMNAAALLCSEEFMTALHAIGDLGASLAKELGMTEEELTQLLGQMLAEGGPLAGNAADESHSDALNAPIDAESAEDAAAMQDAAEMQDATEETSGLKTQEQQTEGTEGELQSDLLSAEDAHESAGGQKHQQFGGAMQEQTGTQLRHDMTGAVGTNVTETAFAQVQEQVNGTGTQVNVADIIKQIVEFSRVTISRTATTMEMQLNPENLGKLYLQLSAKDGIVSAHITAQNEVVKEALESQIVQFKENMNDAGIKVDAVEVTVGSHEFEKNLEQNAKQDERQAEEQEKAAGATRQINLKELDEWDGVLTEEESLVAQMMAEQGNSIDFTA